MNQNYIIGLDLGVNNVGWAIIDEKKEKIEKAGVRLYNIANKAENRRLARNTRRRIKRKDNRINESLLLFTSINFPSENTIDEKLLEKRLKGLTEKLEPQEIVNIVCYFMSHRGYIPFGDEERDLVVLNNLYPCEYYNKLLKEKGKYRSLNEVVNHTDLEKELIKILDTQKKYYPELNNIIGNTEEGLIYIFNRKRKFWEGPGSVDSLTPYGRFKTEQDVINYKNNNTEKFLFEELIGHCKIYRNEVCVPKGNYFAEIFNLVNDFTNIYINKIDTIKKQEYIYLNNANTYKLTSKAIEDIIDYCKINYNATVSYPSVLKNVLGLSKNDIAGFRVDTKGSPLFSLLNIYRYIKKTYEKNNVDFTWLENPETNNNYNNLIKVLAIAPGIVEMQKLIPEHTFSDNELIIIKEIKTKLKNDGFFQYHALSEKALTRAIKDMLNTNLNFMQVSKKFNYDEESKKYFLENYSTGENLPLINNKFVDEIIASPQVKKTLRQAIRIINAIIIEKGCYPTTICVESTKDVNNDEEKRRIEKEIKNNKELKDKATQILEKNFTNEKITPVNILKTMLYEELNGVCPYCNEAKLDLNSLINSSIEIEHILPLSQSGDDSYDNKTLSCRKCNDNKGKRTPFGFMTPLQFEDFTKRINANNLFSKKKKENFLTQEDINKYQIKFFHRNLRDTAYATKELINQINIFNDYLKTNFDNLNILTLSTPGQLTHKIRENTFIAKDREDGKYHHAVDASIVGIIATTLLGKNIINSQNNPQYWFINKDKLNELPKLIKDFNLFNWKKEIEKIKSDEDIFISKQVNKDINKSMANANITSYILKNEKYYKISFLNDIYDPNLFTKEKNNLDILFDENNNKLILLCQEQDPKLFNLLKDIYLNYQNDKSNPFLNYCLEKMDEKEQFDYLKHGIKTPSKNNKGVIVKKLRYMQNVSMPYLLEKKNIHKKENTLIGLDSVSTYCIKLYWDIDEEKIIFFPLYLPMIDFNTKRIKTETKLYQYYYDMLLANKNTKFITNLFSGNYLEITKTTGEITKEFISHYSKSNKSIQCTSGGYLSPKDKFTLYDVDILGNKKKRLTWPEK